MSSGSKDLINNLPDELLCHILSFLTTKEAALTSVIARRWRHLLAFVKNLDFDDSIYLHHEDRVKNPLEGIYPPGFKIFVNGKRKKLSTSFPDFVNRILGLQGNATVEKVSFKIVDDYDPVDKDSVIFWIHNVLLRGVSDLHLRLDLDWDDSLPSRIFLSQTLVSLKLHTSGQPSFDVKHVHLPKLKILHLEIVMFEKDSVGFSMLMSGCPVLEELVMDNICSYLWEYFSVSVSTLKRLTFHWNVRDENPCSVSFVTPNLAYLEYTEVVADEYPKVNLDSLVEAKIDLRMTDDQVEEVRIRYEANDFIVDEQFVQGNEGNYVVGNATDFIVGIRNVQILYLSANTLEVLTFCCKTIPVFNKLTHLTIKSDPEVGWESLPRLLKNCPVLKTLVFQGLLHRATDKCGDMCLCRSRDEDVATCLSSSPVKVLKILINDEKNIERQIEQVNHFLQWMPQLELLVVYYDSSFDGDVNVSMQLQMLTGRTSPKCNIQLISRDLSKPSTMPTSKWGPLL